MEFLVGIRGEGHVLMANDCQTLRSIVAMSRDEEDSRFVDLGENSAMMGVIGEGGDVSRLKELVSAESVLSHMRTSGPGVEPKVWSVSKTAWFIRNILYKNLRTRNSYTTSVLVGGVSSEGDASLYWIDNLASLQELDYGAHGYGSYFLMGYMDCHYKRMCSRHGEKTVRPDMHESVSLLCDVYYELQQRFIINMPRLIVRCVTRKGVHRINIDLQEYCRKKKELTVVATTESLVMEARRLVSYQEYLAKRRGSTGDDSVNVLCE